MRLLHTKSLKLKDFFNLEIPRYAILSHRWSRGQEVSHEEFSSSRRARKKPGYRKILKSCEIARVEAYDSQELAHGFEWIWIDTCCIDQRSSAELSEAINSMYRWYERASICIVYMSDVDSRSDRWEAQFRASEWFRRGWTLQELLAPRHVLFYDCNFRRFGDKMKFAKAIEAITGIPQPFLYLDKPLSRASVAERMSWASMRTTTREEDMAYCLLGVFNVNMPLLYGEGEKAFTRLQHEILSKSDDESIFAWTVDPGESYSSFFLDMLAPSVAAFKHCGQIEMPGPWKDVLFRDRPSYRMTNKGLEFSLPVAIDWIHESMDVSMHDQELKDIPAALVQLACHLKQDDYGNRSRVFILLAHIRSEDKWIRLPTPSILVGSNRVTATDGAKCEFRPIRVDARGHSVYIDRAKQDAFMKHVREMLAAR